MIDYCKDLNKRTNSISTNGEKIQQNAEKANVENVLTKGDWAKEKGVELIKSKKENPDNEIQNKVPKKKKVIKR